MIIPYLTSMTSPVAIRTEEPSWCILRNQCLASKTHAKKVEAEEVECAKFMIIHFRTSMELCVAQCIWPCVSLQVGLMCSVTAQPLVPGAVSQ
jgi:hypothetical protein